MTTTSNYDIYPPEEITLDDSPEAQAAIKELEKLLEPKKADLKRNSLLLKKTIQDLEAFESDKTANGGKNNYAWVKLGAGGKLVELKIIKLDQERKLRPKQ